ncbi:MAG: AAA family ATPase, partial [Myxococcales bacterium]|nr:AAA family ATPase [Myxococcales bacterium]
MKNLPIGIQTFSELIEKNYVYVDKTNIIHDLIARGKVYFFARPRRFGKSLLISTLQSIFEGKRELFKGLAIDSLDYNWVARPVVHLSFSSIPHGTLEQLNKSLLVTLHEKFSDYNLVPAQVDNPALLLINLVKQLHAQHGPVVILIDEYDKPVVDHLDKPVNAEAMRFALREFYQVIKDLDGYLYFVFITGISKFTQTSIFSGLNNLKDISVGERTATLCGYTKKEIELNFDDYLQEFAARLNVTLSEIINMLEHWYDGYSFEWGCEKVFNPFSVLNALDSKKFLNYWVATGTPNFLATMFKEHEAAPQLNQNLRVDHSDLVIVNLEKLPFVPVLVQTGYLTIVGEDRDGYILDFPNYEVSSSYALWSLAGSFNKESTDIRTLGIELRKALKVHDFDNFFQHLIPMFASIPIDIQVENREKYYQSILYLLCMLVGLDMGVELSTNVGIIDAVIKTDDSIII